MANFFDKMEEEVTMTYTENGSPAFSSTLNKNLDFFSVAGAARGWYNEDVKLKFADAFRENTETALRNLVYLRDIRGGGLGERKAFRASLNFLIENKYDNILINLCEYLPELSRWDDVVYIFYTTKSKRVKNHIAKMVLMQLAVDDAAATAGQGISLLAKWLPSNKTSNKDTMRQAAQLIQHMFGSNSDRYHKVYRKLLSKLRDHLNVVEVRMTAKEWDKIEYSHVPSLASIRYRNAFMRNDEERYTKYLEALSEGKTKVNASVTYPYQIVQAYTGEYEVSTLLEEAWKSLPDYIGDSEERAIVVADTSGSMRGTPMDVSISLAIYCAQRLKGEFHGKYITFSANPELNTIMPNSTLKENIDKVMASDWGMNTDINKVFDLILQTAVNNNMTQEELPSKIIIVSD